MKNRPHEANCAFSQLVVYKPKAMTYHVSQFSLRIKFNSSIFTSSEARKGVIKLTRNQQ